MHIPAQRTTPYRLVALLAALILLVGGIAVPQPAFGETTDINAEPDELQQRVEESSQAYNEATENLASLEEQIDDVAAQLDELEETLPQQQQNSAEAVKALYLLQQDGFSILSYILGAESFEDFIKNLEYINRIQQSYLAEVTRLSNMKAELEKTEESLGQKKQAAQAEKIRAEDALAQAQEAREEAQRKAIEAQKAEEERLAAEKAAAEKAAADAAAAAEQQAADTSTQTGTETINVVTPTPIDWSTDKQAFVSQWAPRIDAYMAGSPMAGTGTYFAAAAWDYGVDPRWSPAISFTESSKGAACFNPYNAWGWGSSSWGSWEEAINAHVRGLARGYGYTISVAAAQKYCPPNWEHWYNTTSAQMERI